ncbi:MAG TPA: non-canonical purine NTP pyrophosphatase, partial [Gemmatimonadales bacterium]|nr:non-canonical purine NTP pyrophosphatase [Gemmatimonadales bacterium]
MKLLVGTRSAGKAREIRELFKGLPFELSFPSDLMLDQLPEEADLERSTSYAENAVSKARYYATRAGLAAVADDSGIEVDALGGAPGPRSARGSSTGTDADNNAKLLEQLAGIPEARRTARYRCVVAYVSSPSGAPEIVEATGDGFVLTEPRGSGG